jgi:hypothetical protein
MQRQMVKHATSALNERHHETKEGTITVDIEVIFKSAFLKNFNHHLVTQMIAN